MQSLRSVLLVCAAMSQGERGAIRNDGYDEDTTEHLMRGKVLWFDG